MTYIIPPDQITKMRQTMDDASIAHNVYLSDPEFRSKVDSRQANYGNVTSDAQNLIPTWNIDDYYKFDNTPKLDSGTSILLQNMAKPQTSPFSQQNPDRFQYQGSVGLGDVPKIAYNMGNEIWNMVRHPIDTTTGLVKLGIGATENAVKSLTGYQVPTFGTEKAPGVAGDITYNQPTPEQKQFNAVVQAYGIPEMAFGAKDVMTGNVQGGLQQISTGMTKANTTAYANPLSTLLAVKGGSELLGKAGLTAPNPVEELGKAIVPESAKPYLEAGVNKIAEGGKFVANAPYNILKSGLGKVAGGGTPVLEEAIKGNPDLAKAMRTKDVNPVNALNTTVQTMSDINQQMHDNYLVQHEKLAGNPEMVPPESVQGLLDKTLKDFGIKKDSLTMMDQIKNMSDEQLNEMLRTGKAKFAIGKGGQTVLESTSQSGLSPFVEKGISNPVTIRKIGMAIDYVRSWRDYSSVGLDNLKKSLQGLDPKMGTRESAFINKLVGGIKDTIAKVNPDYNKMLSDHSETSKFLDEIKQELIPTNKWNGPKIGSAIRKLTSAMRSDVQGNSYRLELLKRLDAQTGGKLMPEIAGAALSSWMPRGLIGTGETLGAISALSSGQWAIFLHPSTWVGLALTSPRVLGEILYNVGVAKNKVPKILNYIDAKFNGMPVEDAMKAAEAETKINLQHVKNNLTTPPLGLSQQNKEETQNLPPMQ